MTNLIAVLVVMIIHMALGALWYSPVLFGKQWLKLMGNPSKKEQEKMKKDAPRAYVGSAISAIIMAYVMGMFIHHMKMMMTGSGWMVGATTGLLLWLGFVATSNLTSVLYEQKKFGLYAINAAYMLVGLVVMGAVLGSW